MPPPSPFFDARTGAFDFDRIREEAASIAWLVSLFGAVALVPMVFVFVLGTSTPLALVLTLLAQFVLAVGAAVVLLHVVYRALRLAGQDVE